MYSHKADLWYCNYLWNYNTNRQQISGQYLHNENVSGDAVSWRHNKSTILKIAQSLYLSEKIIHFDKVWYITADIEPNYSHVTKN